MSDTEEPDLNIDSWDIENLIELFNIYTGIDKSNILDYVKEKKLELLENVPNKDREKYSTFLNEAEIKVENEIENINKELDKFDNKVDSLNDADMGEMKVNLVGGDKVAQLREDLDIPQTYSNIPVVQGTKNPILQNTYITWLNIDSQYIELTKSTSSSTPLVKSKCGKTITKPFNKIEKKYTATDFTFKLDSALKNVIKMCLLDMEIDINGYQPFSQTYGNLDFEIDNGEIHQINIDEGNYQTSELETEINSYLTGDLSGIKVSLNKRDKKTYFYGEPKKIPWITQNDIINNDIFKNLKDFDTVVDKNNFIYLIGGFDINKNELVDDIYFLDLNQKNKKWIKFNENIKIKTKRKNFKSIISDDEILYIIGGLDEGDNYLDSIESFDLKITDNWWIENQIGYYNYLTENEIAIKSDYKKETLNDLVNIDGWREETVKLNTARSEFAIIKTENDIVYILGGKTNINDLEIFLDTVESVDLKNFNLGFRLQTKKLTEKKCGLGAVYINNDIYVIGGKKRTTTIDYSTTIEKLNLTIRNNQWEKINVLQEGRSNFGVTSNFKNRIYIFGGEISTNKTTDTMEILDVDNTNNWLDTETKINFSRSHFGVVSDSEESFYILGGVSGEDNIIQETERFKSNIQIIWYRTKTEDYCLSRNKGKKINSSLGWSLGFRELISNFESTNNNNLKYLKKKLNEKYGVVSEAIYNLYGTKYILLEVDDFNKNRHTGKISSMSMPSEIEKFKTPEYAKKIESAYSICVTDKKNLVFNETTYKSSDNKDKNIVINRGTRMGTPALPEAVVGRDTLTSAQKYTALQIKNHQIKSNLNLYFAPHSENILYRSPFEIQTDNNSPLVITNIGGMEFARNYFGPVTIERLRVRLLDDKGYPINLGPGGNISLSLLFSRLYQH